LEFYASAILDEPPISTTRHQHLIGRLTFWDQQRTKRIGPLDANCAPPKKDQQELFKMDMVIIDFFFTPVQDRLFLNVFQKRRPLLSKASGDSTYTIDVNPEGRSEVFLNGIFAHLLSFSTQSNWITFPGIVCVPMLVENESDVEKVKNRQAFEPEKRLVDFHPSTMPEISIIVEDDAVEQAILKSEGIKDCPSGEERGQRPGDLD
jgi:hypothetical protein